MLEQICLHLKNFFIEARYSGTYTVKSGMLSPSPDALAVQGNYFRIVGSSYHDGVYESHSAALPDTEHDETFTGQIWVMRVPPAFLALSRKIEEWQNSDAAKPSAFTSESFGGYTYTRATGKDGGALTWQDVFANELNAYRRARIL